MENTFTINEDEIQCFIPFLKERYGHCETLDDVQGAILKETQEMCQAMQCSFEDALCFILDSIDPNLCLCFEII